MSDQNQAANDSEELRAREWKAKNGATLVRNGMCATLQLINEIGWVKAERLARTKAFSEGIASGVIGQANCVDEGAKLLAAIPEESAPSDAFASMVAELLGGIRIAVVDLSAKDPAGENPNQEKLPL